jgi:hypothetical protein
MIDILKAAFVQGRLTQDELGIGVGRALAARTHAELTAITAGVPAGLIEARPPRKAARAHTRKPVNKKVVAWSTCAIASLPALWAAFLTFYGGFLVMFVLVFLGLTVTSPPWPSGPGTRSAPDGASVRCKWW